MIIHEEKKLQKILLKRPLFSSEAHSDMNLPSATHKIPAPNPLMAAVAMSSIDINSLLSIPGQVELGN